MSREKIQCHIRKTENLSEYDTLRQEILNSIAACDNYKMAMYTVTVAILCLAFELENPILFLIPYIILFAFQWAISSKNENNIVIGAYIAVYLENGQGWESNNGTLKQIMRKGNLHTKPSSFLSRIIGRISSVQLGLLCSISCIIYSIIDLLSGGIVINVTAPSICVSVDAVVPSVCIVMSIVLYSIIRIQTKDVLNLGERKAAYIENLRAEKEKEQKREKKSELMTV